MSCGLEAAVTTRQRKNSSRSGPRKNATISSIVRVVTTACTHLGPRHSMPSAAKPPGSKDAAAVVLGYLNFSSGTFDAAAWRGLSDLYATLEPAAADGTVAEGAATAVAVAAELRARLGTLEAEEPAFRDAAQARWAIDLVFDTLLPAYRRFHADLLEHQPPGGIERPFLVMEAIRATLAEGSPDDDRDAVVQRTIDRLDDYVGWRPLAVLENGRLSAPYAHERVRPIPLYVAGAGVAHGRYGPLVSGAISILGGVPAELLRAADFELEALAELAIDPRAFDFLHPAASRPNYLFGLWDPARIDERGRYRRMVVQQATLDGILSWPDAAVIAERTPATAGELRWESSAVLAGVMLMASGLSGHGPGAIQAGLPLAELLPRIASYRDEFYRRLLAGLPEGHRRRLEEEARVVRQPFGGVRRHINAMLAGRRARQVEHVALAAVFARLGRADAAERLVAAVPAAGARMFARITGRVVAAQQAVWRGGDTDAAVAHLDAAADLLHRAVECGAAVDPWNILGLSGQFPLHEPGGESLPDPRVDDLVSSTGSILEGYAAAWRQAGLAAADATSLRAATSMERLAAWWDRHATTTVSGVPHLSGRECVDSSREVLASLERRRAVATEPPPAGFWRREVASFSSPRTHAQAADALLDEGDLDGAAGLLVHWASLLEGEAVERSGAVWLAASTRWIAQAVTDGSPAGRSRVRRFLELVEANTGAVVDIIEAAAVGREPGDAARGASGDEDDQPDAEERVAAAYESMVWRDSTDDGIDGGMLDVDGPGGSSLGGLAAVEDAAEFLRGVFRLFREAVTAWCVIDAGTNAPAAREELDSVVGWRHTLRRLRRTMIRAATLVAARDDVPPPGMPPQEFDRLRWQRDAAAERLIEASVQAGETLWTMSARLHLGTPGTTMARRSSVGGLLAALVRGDVPDADARCRTVCERLTGKPVLYVPLSRGGRPDRIVRARTRERLLERLAAALPRAGLVRQAVAVVQLAKALESRRPPGAASVSEFDRVFEAGTMALVERIVESSRDRGGPPVTERILDGLALLVPRLLDTWMTHARQLRLSVLERVRDDKAFAAVREFVERYGSGLFTQHLLAPSSLRGILRGGVRNWLEELVERTLGQEEPEAPSGRRPQRLVDDLASGVLPMKQAATRLRLVLESIAENHAEYRDWNSTTTQSDRGECLHILLDYLRVKAEHDRIAWTLRPVNMAHRVLARRGAGAAGEAWRERLREETRDTAAALVEKLASLEGHWSVRLASIADRVRRPFTASLEQDELEALVEPAVAELVRGEPAGAGAALEAKATAFLGVASGSGVEVPDWLDRLGVAIDRAIERADAGTAAGRAAATPPTSLPDGVPWAHVPWDALREALAD